MIPPGWKEAHIGDIVADLKSGLSRKLSLSDIGLPVIRSTNITDQGLLDLSDIKYWYRNDPQGVSTENYFLQPGDILVNFINSVAQIGKCALYQGELNRDTIYTTNIFCVRVNDRILPGYFSLLSRTREYAHYIHSITKPAVNQASFTTKDFKRFRFALPPLSEQRKIVDILGTWDQAIALTERRTEAARQRKEGLMQRLLTGRARFPEFEREEWRTVRFHDVFQRVTRKNESENQNVLTMSAQLGLVSQTEYFNKRVASKTLSHYYLLKTGEFAYNKSYSSGYPFGAVKRLDAHKEGVLSTLYICFRLRNAARYDSDFFTHFFEAGQLNKGIYAIAQEGARNHGLLNISISGFFDLTMTVPSYEEQKRIASVLNACDREIELLTQKHDALQRQKKGLMQRLLTGRVRVEV